MENFTVEMQYIIHFLYLFENPQRQSIYIKKSQLTWSYAFSTSNLHNTPEIPDFNLLLQLLKDRGLLPELSLQIENIVCALDVDLQGAAARVASILREQSQTVDLVLESKPLKWY